MTNNIIQGYPTPQKEHYKVCVRSCTYNQSKYIEDCLNGVAMQKTDFPFVHHVIDDCSTDGEQGVINAWIERECDMDNAEYYDNDICTITLAKHKLSPNYTIAAYFLKQNMFGTPKKRKLFELWQNVCPYIALCEGDDYWIDPLKLQKQVDWLDSHSDCTMSCTDANIESESSMDWKRYDAECDVPVTDIILGGGLWLQTCSFVFRKDILMKYGLLDFCTSCHIGDYCLCILASLSGSIHYFPEKTCTYRYMLPNSWTKKNNESINVNQKIPGWISEVKMLSGFDEYSGYRYHVIFNQRMSNYVWFIVNLYPNHAKQILSSFKQFSIKYSMLKKLDFFLLCNNLVSLFYLVKRIKKIIKWRFYVTF